MVQYTIRIGRLVVGVTLLAVGGVLAIPGVPGPGLLVIFTGLTVLSHEFHWARRLRDRMRATFDHVVGRRDGRG